MILLHLLVDCIGATLPAVICIDIGTCDNRFESSIVQFGKTVGGTPTKVRCEGFFEKEPAAVFQDIIPGELLRAVSPESR